MRTDILHCNLDAYFFPICLRRYRRQLELAVAQSVSEGEHGLDSHGIEITVANENIFVIILLERISVVGSKGCTGRIIRILPGPGIRQTTGRCALAGDNIRQRVSAFIAVNTHQQYGIDTRNVQQEIGVNDAGVQYYNGMGEMLCNVF